MGVAVALFEGLDLAPREGASGVLPPRPSNVSVGKKFPELGKILGVVSRFCTGEQQCQRAISKSAPRYWFARP